jgi:hypothetical protein
MLSEKTSESIIKRLKIKKKVETDSETLKLIDKLTNYFKNESEFETTDIKNLTKILSDFILFMLERVQIEYSSTTKMEWFSFVKATKHIWPELFVCIQEIAKDEMKPIMKKVKISSMVISKINLHDFVKNKPIDDNFKIQCEYDPENIIKDHYRTPIKNKENIKNNTKRNEELENGK